MRTDVRLALRKPWLRQLRDVSGPKRDDFALFPVAQHGYHMLKLNHDLTRLCVGS